ncbi:ankyrin-2-like isoform X3 [Planococcus citri]|uniref:ankyrin-2-like isoform X3 n=1 Tax=Planococcus citri TaxID=170843 RepID=UPI0031F7A930
MNKKAPSLISLATDGNTAFLRAARSGNLEKVLEFINANVDINTSNSNGLNALHLASKDGHVEVAAELLKRGANVDAATKKGNTALHIASLAGQEEVVKLLIEHGASVNLQSQSGFTPLYMAAQENHERVVRYLLNNGANQSLATEDGFTPLAVAMQQGHDKVVTELLENDTRGKIKLPALHIAAKKDDCKAAALLLQSEHNPDITSKSGFTPLHIASHYGNDAIASLLLAKGADVNYAAKHNITPLHVAAKWGRNNMVILLLDKGASIIAKTRDGLTPLHCAARSGHEQVVDTLLQRHAPITAKTKNGLAPLHMASQGDHVEAARVLLSHRAPVDDVTVDYLTALHVASHCGHVSVAKLLLDRKADPNARALNGFTPLHIACKKNRVKIVELLLKHGGSIEATTESGLSPLHVASFMGCMNIVIYLLQCGANPDVSTIRGETPLHLASRANQTDIIRILLRNGAQVDAKAREQQTPLHIAARLGNTDIVMLLLQHGANVDSVTKDLYTSLHIAAKEDQEEVAQALLENNASMTATTKKGFTPLHLAAKYGRSSIATLLLQRGAPVDAQGKNGVTPLHVASHYDHQGIALLLLDKGASPHATAKNGHTPLHIAAKKNQMDIAAMLLEYGANAGAESKAGFTPLHLSAQEGHVDMTNLLLEHKADVNHSSKNGLTPLHLCAQEDCVDVATILVKNGADVNNVTKAGYTPLHIASHFGQLNMVRFLLSNKAKVDTATSTGYTPLHQAAQQGNSAIVAVLLDNGASPDTKNNQGQTALCIAQKLGYISVVEVLKNVTDNTKAPPVAAAPTGDEKYKVVAPETMQENFMSDSEDEGGDEVYMAANGTMSRMCDSTLYLQYYEKNTLFMREDATNEQSYRYLTIDEMKSLGDDSLPIDTSKEDRYDTTAGHDESISPQHTYNQLSAAPVIDNVDVTRAPVIQTGKLKWKSFLVSFLVDAKGGAMRGCRHSGVRVIVPPQCVTMPTRVTCRYIRRDKPNHPPPPPLMEGEALASRILELGPVGVKFLGPVVIEVPNFAALRANEREIVILRSDNGETWREHTVDSSSEAVHDILSRSFDKDGNQIQSDEPNRITSIVTHDFPHYFAIVSRIRQEVHAIGPEGGMVSSSVVPQVQAVFPQGALTKKIKVGLQAQPIPSELTAAVLGNCVAVSPIVTIEPRRRKFHKPITLTLPVPQAANKGMINQYSGDAPTLRLLCSITGGTSRAQWEDVTGSTPLTFVKECVSFTTTVSARFWLMDIRDIAVATKKATELYREAIHIPFMAKFVVFAKRIDNNEARLRVFCMTDDKEDKTLENQEHFTEVAKSRDVEVLEGKKQLIELSGNLISVTKSGDQLKLGFNAFQENRLPFTIRIKDSLADPIGRMLFFKEQKPVKTSTPHPPICVLNIVLPDTIIPDSEFGDSPIRKYNLLNDSQGYHRSELKFSDISNLIGEDWEALAEKLGIRSSECKVIKIENPEGTARQSSVMLKQWNQRAGTKATANILESALLSIGREDIVQECFLNTNQKNKLPNENGLITHKAEDIRGSKKDPYSTDDDEKKYTAEEKIIDETELKSVSERKQEIEKRLQDEQNNKKENLKERSESEERRPLSSKQSSEDREIIKNVVHEDKETFEPAKMTFQQKRLSFEKGYSVDKILSEGIAAGDTAQSVVEEQDKTVKREKSVDKVQSVQKEPTPEKSPEDVSQKPLKKEKSVESKIPVQKNKSDDKIAQKTDQREKTPEDKKPAQKGKSVEKSASKDKVDKVLEKSPSKDKVDKPLEKSASKDKVDKTLEKSASKDKVDKTLEKSASKDKVDKSLEKSASKDKVDKPLEKSASKDKVNKPLEKSASKDKVDKSLEKSASKDKVAQPLEKSASKDKVNKPLEKSASKDKVDKSLEKSSSKDKVAQPLEKSSSKDKVAQPLEKSSSKDKVEEKVSTVVEKPVVEEKVKPTEKAKSSDKQPSEDGEKSSTFQEKRLSFEQSDGSPSTTTISQTTVVTTKIPSDEAKAPETISKVTTTTTTTTTVEKRSDTDARRDSELFEGVSLGLGKLEAKPIPAEQNFLSPKPLMTPPPSPAEFSKEGSEEWHKTDSLDSNRSNKSVTDIETPSETQTVTPTEYTGNKQLSTESDTTRSFSRDLETDTVDKEESMDYVSRKKFWQSFESASVDKVSGTATSSAPVPKPRASICTTGVTIEEAPVAAKRSTENIRSGFVVSKSESMQERVSSDTERFSRPSMKKVHSLMSYSTDSEAEYIATCGIEKLAYENVAFSEEDESISEAKPEPEVESGVKARKMFFEKMQSNSSQESITSPPSKKDEIAGIVKTSIVSTEKQIKKDSSPDSVPSQICETDKHVSLVKSATASIEKRIEQPVKRDSSQESITSPLSKKDEIISGVTNEKPLKKDSSLDSVSSTSSKKVENVGLVKSATASIEKRIEQPMKRDSSQESVTSPLSKKDEIISGVTDEKPLKKDSSLDSVSSTSSKKVENVGLVKSATASIEKRIEQPVKRDSSQESVTSPVSKKDEISGVTAGAPLKTNSSLDGASSTLSKKDGLVKSATASIEKRIEQPVKRDSSQEKVTSPLTKKDEIIGVASEKQIRKDSSQDSISSTPSKKDDHVSLVKSAAASIEKQIEKEQSTTGLVENTTKVIKTGSIEKIETPVKKEPSQESISNVSLKKDSPVIHMESVTSSIEQIIKQESSKENITSLPSKKDEIVHTTPTTILSNQENLEQPLKKDSFVTSDKKEEVVKTTIAKEPTKTITKKEDVEITTSEKVEPSVTTKVKETVVTTSSASKIDAPVVTTKVEETVVTTSPEGKLVTTIIKEETSTESIEKHLSSKIDEKIVSIHKVTEQPVKGDVSLKKVPSKDESLSQVETTAVITTTKTFEEPVIKDSSKEVVTCEQLVCSIPTTTLSSTTVTTTRTQSKPSIDKDSSIESVTSVSSKQGDLSNLIKSTVTTSISITEKSISKDPSLDSVTSLSFKADEPAGVISENSQCKDSICDSSSLSSKKDRPIEATDIVKLDTQSPSTIESKPNGSLDESIDSTQSESDITPEDLRDKQFIMQDWESTSELLENLVQDRTIPMAQSSGIVVQEISQSQIRFSDSEQYKHFNSTPAFSEDDSECEALKEEAKAAAENLINEIEEELGKRPDIVECLLKNKIDELVEEIASSSNDITDEDLKSTGTEIDLPMPYGFEDPTLMKMKISQASPTEYEIKFEQVEEFNVLESVDFEEPIIPDDMEIGVQSGSESLMSLSKKEVIKPSRIPIRNGAKSSAESKSPVVQRKTSEEDKSRTSTSPEYVQDFIEIRQAKHHRKSGADFEPCSSSSESHYHSFEHSGTTSRPLSSDVEGLLSGGGVPGTTGSSEYETAASHDTSHDFHTAMSSASLHESIKSIDSESSGNLGSAEVSSEVSETLVASSAELDHDIDLPPSHYYDDNTRRSAYRSSPIEPYDHDIPMEVIKGVSQSFDMSHLEPFANSQKKSVEPALQVRSQSAKFREDLHEIDDKLLSSSEDVSMFSLTDGGTNLQTVIEVNSAAESDKMDNSIISEQSLTISATSNQFSTSSSAELKDEIEGDKKPGDLNSVQSTQDLVTKSSSNASATCAQISSSKIDKSDSKDTICRDISIDDIPNITIQHSTPPQHPPVADIVQESPSKDPSISPDSESFELIEQPDMMDDFVIIEEVAKEACEQDPEGKSIKITGKRQIAMSYDDEIVIPPKTSSTLTRIEYYGGADGCGFPIEGVPEVASKPAGDENDVYEHEVEEGKKWIEMQFQADSEDASGYEYGYERGPLEDIKEEDTDDMQSSKMGSVGSQISQSIGSLGSMKQSLSSTPDYDILAGKRYFANKSSDKDDVSQGSLQEFERLEQLMTLESVKNKLSGSQDSLGSNNSTNGGGSKKRSATGDDVSVSSLNEFEGLEHACLEAEKVKERARIEEHLLSQIEEGHESQASESESCETLEKSCYESDNDEDYDQKMFEIDEIIRQAQSNVEKFVDVDQLERTESLGRGDSFEETARIPDFELDQPLTENTHSSSDIYSGKKYIEHFDLSHSLTTSTDSLEPKGKPGDILVTSTDSLEGGPTTATTSKSKSTVISDSLDATDNRVESPRSAYDADEELQIGAGDDFDTRRLSPHHLMLSSPDSLDATSSAGTHATYHNETDSAMSSSFTSAGSNTMISSTENLENIVTNYSNWLDSNPYMTEVAYNVSDKSYVTTERVAESSNQQRTTSSQGQDAKKLYEKDMAAFQPGEYYSETREVDSDGNVHIKKVVESRAVVTSEKVQSSEKIILDPEQYRGHVTNTDFTTVSSSSSHFVTTTTSTTTESSSGFKTESNVRVEKKEVSGEGSSDKPKS